jgi:hypothetical protein
MQRKKRSKEKMLHTIDGYICVGRPVQLSMQRKKEEA